MSPVRNLVVIGVGPFAISAHFPKLKQLGLRPALVVDLESQRSRVLEALREFGFQSQPLFLIPDCYRDVSVLPEEIAEQFAGALNEFGITQALLSCEPKGKLGYLDFLLNRGIDCFSDKPILTFPGVTTDPGMAENLAMETDRLFERYRSQYSRGARAYVNVRRRHHPAYVAVAEFLRAIAAEYDVPMTHFSVTSTDGTWNHPDEYLSRENHPYKYGYGKIMHSGYHQIDFLAYLIATSGISDRKQPDTADIRASAVRPADLSYIFDEQFYQKVFPAQDYSAPFKTLRGNDGKHLGEVDLFSSFRFLREGRVMTTAHINLLSTSFCRRAWAELPADTYRKNGRLRHECVNIQVGPLANIQVHEYQTQKDDPNSFVEVIFYRNVDLIGGKVLEKLQFHPKSSALEIFLQGGETIERTNLREHELTNKFVVALCASIANENVGLDARSIVKMLPVPTSDIRPEPAFEQMPAGGCAYQNTF